MSISRARRFDDLNEFTILALNIELKDLSKINDQLGSLCYQLKLLPEKFQFENCLNQHESIKPRIIVLINGLQENIDVLYAVLSCQKVYSVYIQCEDTVMKEFLSKPGTDSTKIMGIYPKIDEILDQIKDDHNENQFDDNRLSSRCFDQYDPDDEAKGNRSFSDLNANFLHSLLILDVLIRMDRSAFDMEELIATVRAQHERRPGQWKHIEELRRTYAPNTAIWWYTRQTFLYKSLNKAFREENINQLYVYRYIIADICEQLKSCDRSNVTRVYRGQWMSDDEINDFRRSINHYRSTKSFWSTSTSREVALFFCSDSNTPGNGQKSVLFQIEIDPSLKNAKPFGNISKYSAMNDENEVLFMARSIFRIVSVSDEDSDKLIIIQLEFCDETKNHFTSIYEQNRTNYGGGKQKNTNPMILGNVLQRMGNYDDAESFYRRQIEQYSLTNNNSSLLSACYFNIAEVLREKGDHKSSLIWYKKSLELDQSTLPENHPNIGNTYNSIGIVHANDENYYDALESHQIALKIALDNFGCDNTRVALCLNNIGNVYTALENYVEALACHRIALNIRLNNLPPGHHRLAASHNNIALVYHQSGYFDLAMEKYTLALRINQKSLPVDHPDTALVIRNMALLEETRGNLSAALLMFEKEYERRSKFSSTDNKKLQELQADIDRIKSKLI